MAYAFVHDLAAKYHTLKGVPLVYQKTIRDSFPIFLVSQPGEQFIYSPGIDWAGLMVEPVTGMKLSKFMRKNIFEPVSAHDVTFHLEQREDLRARRVTLWERDMTDLKEVTDFWWPDPAIDDIGGGGIYTTVHDLLKIYLGVLQGKLLHSTTLKVMFSPQLESRKGLDVPEIYNVNSRNAIYNSIPNDIPSDFGIGGLVNTEKVSGRRSEYSLTWSGMRNCY
nr:transesterase [Colletotrichum truncatum]KAF6782447.1 transesterase [Colletotrichum truncatum]